MSKEAFIELEDKEGRLRLNADSFPLLSHVRGIHRIRTAISDVILLSSQEGPFAFKLRRHLKIGDMCDFTTLEKREKDCQKEIEKNRALFGDLYLGVVPAVLRENLLIFESSKGGLYDWAVKMRRFQQKNKMDNRLQRGLVSQEDVLKLARVIAEFHRNLPVPKEARQYGSLVNIQRIWQENFDQAQEFVGKALSQEELDKSRRKIEHFLKENEPLFLKRLKKKKILDCHGDLHSGNVLFENGQIKPFDALEFNPAYSICDVASEIAFMSMDLEFLGHPALAKVFVDEYVRLTGDQEIKETGLLDFYKAHRAWVRGKVNGWDKDFVKAKQYFKLASSYL